MNDDRYRRDRGRRDEWSEREREYRERDRGTYLDEPDQYYTSEYRHRDWRDDVGPNRHPEEDRWYGPRGDRNQDRGWDRERSYRGGPNDRDYDSDYEYRGGYDNRGGYRNRYDTPGYRRDYEDPLSMRHVRTDYARTRPHDYDDPNRARDPRSFGYDPQRTERYVRYEGDRNESAPRGYRGSRGIRPYDRDWERGDPYGDRSYPDDDYEFGGHGGGGRTDRTHRSDYDNYRYGSGRWGGGRNW